MDTSFLSNPTLIKASRAFVCVRVATYENALESAFIETLGAARRGGVANTAFVLLAPDGETRLTKAGRSPRQLFDSDDEDEVLRKLVGRMKEVATRYPGGETKGAIKGAPVPYHVDLRRALNVTSCDLQPLVVVSIPAGAKREGAERALAALAWSDAFRGRFGYARVVEAKELATLAKASSEAAVFVVQPGDYGLKGKVLTKATAFDAEALGKALREGLAAHARGPKPTSLIRAGVRGGGQWKAETAPPERRSRR